MRFRRLLIPLAALVVLAASVPAANAGVTVGHRTVATGLTRPVFVTNSGDGRLFIVEQAGVIKVMDGSVVSTYYDIHDLVRDEGFEEGLLGLAFHPDFRARDTYGYGKFYVYYTYHDGNNYVREYDVRDPDANAVGSRSTRLILKLPHPTHANHNGGMLVMRKEGTTSYLYVGTGDGGGRRDPGENAEDLNSPLGKILRIVPTGTAQYGYTIPTSNPFYGSSSADDRVWAYGLRNPWRFSFDRSLGSLWIADVGEDWYEEINRHHANSETRLGAGRGLNFGWDMWEARSCFEAPCTTVRRTFPVSYYAHSVANEDNCSVTGGYVYRGKLYSFLRGLYFFADFCSGRIWTVSGSSTNPTLTMALRDNTPHRISSFGESASGELYFTTLAGNLYRITATYQP